jgi:hypothetical protein
VRFYLVILDPGRDRYRIALALSELSIFMGNLRARSTSRTIDQGLTCMEVPFSPRPKSCDTFQHCSALLCLVSLD